MILKIFAITLLLIVSGCASQLDRHPFEASALDRVTETSLVRFENSAAFRRYLRSVERIADTERNNRYSESTFLQYAQVQSDPDVITDECIEDECLEDRRQETVTVTGSKATTTNPSITNNQEAGVEEGDIIKQIDDYLIVLQDGRLFSVDLRPDNNDGLSLIDRQNVYWNEDVDTWYDEMLVAGRRIVVTGYSYDADASEVSILSLSEDGKFVHEDTFYISSDDYYDSDNYATRIVGDKFIVHTPIYLSSYSGVDAIPWPVMRHWGRYFRVEDYDDWEDLPTIRTLNPRDVYKPIQKTISPVVHTITICDIGGHQSGKMMDCDARAVVAPEGHEFYVSQTDVFLWTWPGYDDWSSRWGRDTSYCEDRGRASRTEVLPATIFKFPINGRKVEAAHVAGRPFDQFGMVSQKKVFRALVDWTDPDCSDSNEDYFPAYYEINERSFSRSPRARMSGKITELPGFSVDQTVENRFTDYHLVYSNSEDSGHYPPDGDEVRKSATLNIVDLIEPTNQRVISSGHSVIRLERLNQDAVFTGYTDASGLHVSVLDLGEEPKISSKVHLSDRFESEGRSHAFNAMIDEDGSGVLGIPTVKRPEDAGRWWWNSDSSDVSFLSMDAKKDLSDSGALLASEADEHSEYECDVSCIDWYGNSRPIFTNGRIFALSGTEIIEGKIHGARIGEVRRVNLTAPIPNRRTGS